MNKPELIKAVAAKVGISQADAEQAISYAFRLVGRAIQQEGRCAIVDFGVFKKVQQAAVSRPSPQDRTKIINTPARNTVRFKPCPALKEAMQ